MICPLCKKEGAITKERFGAHLIWCNNCGGYVAGNLKPKERSD